MIQVSTTDFSLKDTLECGQAFRWRRAQADGWYYGFIPVRPEPGGMGGGPCAVKAGQEGSRLTVLSLDPRLTPEAVRRYFALDIDLPAILSTIDVDAQIHDAIKRHRGLRILRQDPWECLASFILASFNNIKRIQGMIERLSQAYGAASSFNGFQGFAFPSAEAIARVPERRLRQLGLGYRAPYLKDTAEAVASGAFSIAAVARADYAATKTALLQCDGVGDKVADCVALFGFEQYEAFPVDVWMERAMRYYFRRRTPTRSTVHAFARQHFGRYAGYAQQYLYQYVRNARFAPVGLEVTVGWDAQLN